MDIVLSQPAVRGLGCLIEKQITTPDYYPLTLNALTTACNQKSNRDPVVAFDDETVISALNELRDLRLIWQTSTAGSRVSKYEHGFDDVFSQPSRDRGDVCSDVAGSADGWRDSRPHRAPVRLCRSGGSGGDAPISG